jgi:hypothetical protein
MQAAANLASKAHIKAMLMTKPGLYEHHISAEFDSEFRKGNSEHSYPPIVASGENACILHYTENNKILNDGDLLLVESLDKFKVEKHDIEIQYDDNTNTLRLVFYQFKINAKTLMIKKLKKKQKEKNDDYIIIKFILKLNYTRLIAG